MPPATGTHSSSSYGDDRDHLHSMPGVKAPITTINSSQELEDWLRQDDRLCLIKFHAAWCKSCQKFGLKYQMLANDHGDWVEANHNLVRQGNMRLAQIEFGANRDLCRSLEIKRLPTVHFYKHGEKIAGFPCGPKKFPMLQDTVAHYLHLSEEELQFEQTMEQGVALIDMEAGSTNNVVTVLNEFVEPEAHDNNNNNNRGSWAPWRP